MVLNRSKTDRVPITTPKALTSEIDSYKRVKGYTSRSKAIQELVKLGLEAEYEKKPELKLAVQSEMAKSHEN